MYSVTGKRPELPFVYLTNRCEKIPNNEGIKSDNFNPRSTRRLNASLGVEACSVAKTSLPVNDARIAVAAVSSSLISRQLTLRLDHGVKSLLYHQQMTLIHLLSVLTV